VNERPVVFLTGASRGIGAATAVEFARRGYDLTLLARSRGDLEKTAGRVREEGGDALIQCGDLADLAFAESAVHATVDHFGRLDVLVNNAAWRDIVTMRTISLESWEKTLRISLTAPAFLAKWSAVQMEKQGKGVIVNISSVMSERCSGFGPAYMAAKGALDTLTYDLAALYGPKGIRVVAVNPGAIVTEMSGDYESDEGENLTDMIRATLEDFTPLRRWGQPEEMARVIAWVSSDEASYITATTIVADGGIQRQLHPGAIQSRMFPGEFP
jgi:NAD(P)-dependent dehydrogenase (short-subunit alcohol dehydrogenase family)